MDEALRLMECSKESLQEDGDKEFEPDKSAMSQIFRLIKTMAGAGGDNGKRKQKRRKQKRFGKGPGRERDMDVDSDEDEGDDDEELSLIDIRARVVNAGFTEAQLMETISEVCWFHFIVTLYLSNVVDLSSMKILTYGCVWRAGQNYNSSLHKCLLSLSFAFVHSYGCTSYQL